MTSAIQNLESSIAKQISRAPFRLFLGCVITITFIRVIALFISDFNLGPDETQYWFWSRTPDFGYFSKPPMIAWIIAFTTGLFGNAEWAARLASPALHAGTALFLYAIARQLQGSVSGFWAGTAWLLLPGVSLSSTLISTDTPLLFFWSGALFFLLRMIAVTEQQKPIAGIDMACLGLCLGLGFLSKYAMIYFLLAGVAGAIVVAEIRKPPIRNALIVSILMMAALITPNILWNLQHDFQTVSHTMANANWQGDLLHLDELLEFWLAQFGIIGPIILGIFLLGLFQRQFGIAHPSAKKRQELLLILFAITPIIIVSIQAFISRAHANWAATSYPAITILAIIWMLRHPRQRLLIASHTIHLAIAIVLFVVISNVPLIDRAGFSNAIKPVRGWDVHGEKIAQLADNYGAVMADDRELLGQILYYGKQSDRVVIAWNSNNRIDDHYEAFIPYKPTQKEPILYVTQNPDAIGVHRMFDAVIRIDQSEYDLKRGRKRTLYFFELSGFRGT